MTPAPAHPPLLPRLGPRRRGPGLAHEGRAPGRLPPPSLRRPRGQPPLPGHLGHRRAARHQGHSAVVPDHLRHACHYVALGKDKSSDNLTNAELDQVLAVFRLMADPDDLKSIIDRDHPEHAERRRLVVLCRRQPEARILAIASNLKTWAGQWEPPFWENIPIPGLRVLARICLDQ